MFLILLAFSLSLIRSPSLPPQFSVLSLAVNFLTPTCVDKYCWMCYHPPEYGCPTQDCTLKKIDSLFPQLLIVNRSLISTGTLWPNSLSILGFLSDLSLWKICECCLGWFEWKWSLRALLEGVDLLGGYVTGSGLWPRGTLFVACW